MIKRREISAGELKENKSIKEQIELFCKEKGILYPPPLTPRLFLFLFLLFYLLFILFYFNYFLIVLFNYFNLFYYFLLFKFINFLFINLFLKCIK